MRRRDRALAHRVLAGPTNLRAPISPALVKVYSSPPPHFEEIAVLNASSKSMFNAGGQRTTDKVVERLKVEAAQLGANGVILDDFNQTQSGSLGTGVGSGLYVDGRLVPNLELGHHPWKKDQSYEDRLRDSELQEIGKKHWSKRVFEMIEQLG